MPEKKAQQEVVIIIEREGENPVCIRKNGHIEYFEMRPMRWQDHVELHGADKIKSS